MGHGLTAFVSGFKITMVPGLDAAATNADVLTLVQRGGLTLSLIHILRHKDTSEEGGEIFTGSDRSPE